MRIEGYTFKEDRLYDLDHSYAYQASDAEVVQGITDMGQGLVGEALFVEMPYVGRRVRQGERLLSIQPMDPRGQVIRLKATVSGEIVAINPALENDPTLVNDVPYSEGWLVVIRPDDVSELGHLHRPDELPFQTWAAHELDQMHLHEMRVGRKVTGSPAPREVEEERPQVGAGYAAVAAK
jgi:glycine cleavage system H protein